MLRCIYFFSLDTRTARKRTDSEDSGESSYKIGQGRLTSELLAQGIITPEILKTLQEEWEVSLERNQDDSTAKRSSKISTRRNKKK